jgi:hypothetical protein
VRGRLCVSYWDLCMSCVEERRCYPVEANMRRVGVWAVLPVEAGNEEPSRLCVSANQNGWTVWAVLPVEAV